MGQAFFSRIVVKKPGFQLADGFPDDTGSFQISKFVKIHLGETVNINKTPGCIAVKGGCSADIGHIAGLAGGVIGMNNILKTVCFQGFLLRFRHGIPAIGLSVDTVGISVFIKPVDINIGGQIATFGMPENIAFTQNSSHVLVVKINGFVMMNGDDPQRSNQTATPIQYNAGEIHLFAATKNHRSVIITVCQGDGHEAGFIFIRGITVETIIIVNIAGYNHIT
jgi:hypothetical protein